jgi:heme oxygenase
MSDATATAEAIDSAGIMDRLRSETRPHHDKAEQNGFGVMVMEGGLQMPHYVEHLAAWQRILRHLEGALRSCNDEVVSETWHEGLVKEEILSRDLEQLAPEGVSLSEETKQAVQAFSEYVDHLTKETPRGLLGVLYVLEGSTMGGSVMKSRIANQLQLTVEEPGLLYYGCYGNQVGAQFKKFRVRMGGAVDGSGSEELILIAAGRTFDLVGDILRAIAGD